MAGLRAFLRQGYARRGALFLAFCFLFCCVLPKTMERKRNLEQPDGTSEREVPGRPKNSEKLLQDHLVVCHLVLFDLPETLCKVVESEF